MARVVVSMSPCFALFLFFAGDWQTAVQTIGDAAWQGEALRLTPPRENQAGAAWRRDKVSVREGFETRFRFRIRESGGLGGGADGLAFVMQNSGPYALAGRGGAGGFAVEGPGMRGKRRKEIGYSLAVFFDTFENQEMQDPPVDSVGLYSFGRPKKAKWPPPRLGVSPPLEQELKVGGEHEARIRFAPPVLTVSLDGEEAFRTTVDIGQVADAEGKAWVGFTAATGAGWGAHEILDWAFESVESQMLSVDSEITFAPADCLPDRNLCTPPRTTVELAGEDRFTVVLSANDTQGVAVPNPAGRSVEIEKASGFICWGAGDCITASGNVEVQNRNGQIRFGVKGKPRANGEGYFVLTVKLR
ncbi:MAG: L-type lectin-domain containing protein [Bryobacter sp.]|nr:L-type lectin-domain containing protein [Bryobacter sp.]